MLLEAVDEPGVEAEQNLDALAHSTSTLRGIRDELSAYGPLLPDGGGTWLGTAALLRAPDPETARGVLISDAHISRSTTGS